MRLKVGSIAPNFTVQALGGRTVDLAALRGRTVLLKFYRFATCPVCNLHMHRFISEYGKLQALGLTTVVLYHSPADKLAEENMELPPFDLVADPEKRIFKAYGVERGLAGMFSFAVMRDYYRALIAGFQAGPVHQRWRHHRQPRRLYHRRRRPHCLCTLRPPIRRFARRGPGGGNKARTVGDAGGYDGSAAARLNKPHKRQSKEARSREDATFSAPPRLFKPKC